MSITTQTFYSLLLLVLPVWAISQTAPIQPQPLAIEGAVTQVYKVINGVELRLHVFNPPSHSASAQQPAIVFFFGGGWTEGRVEQFVPQSLHLARRGMVAIVADYRVLDRHGTSPVEAMADAKSAIRWVRTHAKELGVDPDRIVASGGSAGGHIALSSAVFSAFDEPGEEVSISSKPNVLVLFNPAVDTSGIARFGTSAEAASPLHHVVAGLPPTVIFHGKADVDVPYAGVDQFCAKARSLGNRCELFGYEGATHGFFNQGRDDNGEWYRATLLEADRFLTNLDYLPKPAPEEIK